MKYHTENIVKKNVNFGFIKFANHKRFIYAARQTYENASNKSNLHFHDFAQVWYCYGGSYTHIIEGETHHCTKGSLCIIPPGTRHDVVYGEDYVDILWMDIHWDMLLESSPEKWINWIVNLYWPAFAPEMNHSFSYYTMLEGESQTVAEECLDWIDLLKFSPQAFAQNEQIYEKIERLFSLPEFAISEKYRNKAVQIAQTQLMPIMRIVSYLNNHFPEKIKEDVLLQEAGISRRGMYRYFERIMAVTYSNYLQSLRVRHVYIYLRTSTYSLAYISDACGFCDVRYMSRVFKSYIGESPQSRRKGLEEHYRQKRLEQMKNK